jgi:methylmalonyl-CoA/ethylmalonyl-CoA epimerase
MKLHHLGIACEDIAETLSKTKKLHDVQEVSEVVFDEKQQASVQLVTLSDGTRLELIAGKIVQSLVSKKVSFYHVCFEVEDIHVELEKAKENGAFVISMPKPSALFEQRLVAFLIFPYGLVEFLEKAN